MKRHLHLEKQAQKLTLHSCKLTLIGSVTFFTLIAGKEPLFTTEKTFSLSANIFETISLVSFFSLFVNVEPQYQNIYVDDCEL